MSLWEFHAAVGGHNKANAGPDDGSITTEQAEQLAAWLDKPPVWH
jgi:hypothetical protein